MSSVGSFTVDSEGVDVTVTYTPDGASTVSDAPDGALAAWPQTVTGIRTWYASAYESGTLSVTRGGVEIATVANQPLPVKLSGNLTLKPRFDAALRDDVVAGYTGRMPQYPRPSSVIAGTGWVTSAGGSTSDPDTVAGSVGASMTTTSAAVFRISKSSLALDMTGKQFRIKVKADNVDNLGNLAFVAASDAGITNYYQWNLNQGASVAQFVTSGDWIVATLNWSQVQTVGAPSRSSIVDVRLTGSRRATTDATFRLAHQGVEVIPDPTQIPTGLVSLCFDDIWSSVWTGFKPTMDANGIQGSIFVIEDLIGTAGRLTLAQLLAMQDQGWEICSHAYTDADHTLSYTGMTAAQLDADLAAQKAALRRLGFAGQGTAYPLGQYGRTIDGQPTIPITRKYFAYARGVHRGTNGTGETFPPSDPFRLRALSAISSFAGGYAPGLLTNTTTGDIDRHVANKGWLIPVFHKAVSVAPAATTEILQADFDAIITKLVSSGAMVLPVGAALRYL